MGDLYSIPHDDGRTYRLKKFVEYQHEVPSIHYRFIGEWIKRNNYSPERAVDMCWYMCVTYNEITCALMDQVIHAEGKTAQEFWDNYGEIMKVGSARKHVKLCGRFILLMKQWEKATRGKPYEWLKALEDADPQKTLRNVHNALCSMKEVARFASDLFIESVSYIKDYLSFNIGEPQELDWINCANLTSGTYNIFYEDERAERFDKTKKIPQSEYAYLTQCLEEIQREIHETYPEQQCTIYSFVGKICSFRNLFKAARYGGFHHDRELGWIREYEKTLPQYKTLWNDCYKLRSKIFQHHLLGELNGWTGIRKERKRLWLDRGMTGVEKNA